MKPEEIITSSSNSRVKYVSALLKKSSKRKEDNVYVVEGLRMVIEAPIVDVKCIYISASFLEKEANISRIDEFLDRCKDYDIEQIVVSDSVMKAMSDTVTPQGILAIINRKNYDVDISKGAYLFLEDIQDPGNLGTLFRTAEAAGIDEIIMSRGCVDIYNPKTIRSTMGTIYRMPHFICENEESWQRVISGLLDEGVSIYGGALNDSVSYDTIDYSKRIGIVIGNEGNGITDDTLSLIKSIHIPMEGQIESLNAAMAGGIIMYEMSRQRRNI